jgi:hypothetical protein
VIYALLNVLTGLWLIGTADTIHSLRKRRREGPRRRSEKRAKDLGTMPLVGRWQLQGDQAIASEIIQRLTEPVERWWPQQHWPGPGGSYRFVQDSPRVRRWFETYAHEWRGRDARKMGIKAPSREKAASVGHGPASGCDEASPARPLGDRVARRRADRIGAGPG